MRTGGVAGRVVWLRLMAQELEGNRNMAVHFRLEFIQLIALDTVGKSNRIHEATETPKRLDCIAVVASLNYSNADLTSHNRRIVATIEDDVRNLIMRRDPSKRSRESMERWKALP